VNVLLIDDESLIREGLSLKLQLEDGSIKARSCGTLEEARKEIAASSPDLIFLDVKMNGDREAGLRFLEELKDQGFPGRIVMLSSENDAATVGRAIGAGAVGFISKGDQDSHAMRRAISLLVQGGVYISDELRQRSTFPPEDPWTTTSIKEVDADHLRITAPRVYETLWRVSRGAPYKVVAQDMGLSDHTVEEYARSGYNAVNARSKTDFLVMLSKKGWKLREPKNLAKTRD
jgi:DNA-binding NarL/FixJ family response regulator